MMNHHPKKRALSLCSCLGLTSLALLAGACGKSDDNVAPQLTDSTSSEIASTGVERAIPVHFVHLSNNPSPAPFVSVDRHERALAQANDIFRPAGIQFYVGDIDAAYVPQLAKTHRYVNSTSECDISAPLVTWSQVQADAASLPNLGIPTNAFPGTMTGTRQDLLIAAISRHSPTDAIHIIVTDAESTNNPDGSPCTYAFSSGPSQYRAVLAPSNFIGEGTGLAHELGHYLGLGHSSSLGDSFDASLGTNAPESESWDLLFCPGTGPNLAHRFYTSEKDAADFSCPIANESIDRENGSQCDFSTTPPTCEVAVAIGNTGNRREWYNASNPIIANGFVREGTPQQAGGTAFSVNIMIADNPPGLVSVPYSRHLSQSQIELVRKNIRFRTTTTDPRPIFFGLDGARDKLGRKPVRSRSAMDFDGDGKRDLAVWSAPVGGAPGTMKVFLSGAGFIEMASFTMGGAGDTPLAADFNGDGIVDLGFFQRGSGTQPNSQAYWTLATTFRLVFGANVDVTFAVGSPIAFGERRDVPIVGTNFDGSSATSELTVYRPDTGQWFWLPQPYTAYQTRTPAVAGRTPAFSPLPGDYDGDGRTDLAGYEPSTSSFSVALASGSWNSIQNHTSLGADFDGSSASVAQAVTGLHVGANSSFGAFAPVNGKWAFRWQGTSTSAPVTCSFGEDGDIPLGGVGSGSDTTRGRIALFRPNRYAGGGQIWLANATSTGCSGAVNRTPPMGRAEYVVGVVPDMTGDGLPDILFADPTTGTVRWLESTADFTTFSNPVTVGSGHSELLLALLRERDLGQTPPAVAARSIPRAAA